MTQNNTNNLVIVGLPSPESYVGSSHRLIKRQWSPQCFRTLQAAGVTLDGKFTSDAGIVGVHDPELPTGLAGEYYDLARSVLTHRKVRDGHQIVEFPLIELPKPNGEKRSVSDWLNDIEYTIGVRDKDRQSLVVLAGSVTMGTVVGCNADEIMAGMTDKPRIKHFGSYYNGGGLVGCAASRSAGLTLVCNA